MTSIRFRLLIIALLPLVLLLPLLLGVTMLRWIDKFDDLLFAKVASDIRVAEQYFKQIEEADAAAVAAIAQSARFDTAAQSAGSLPRLLEDEKARLGFDLLLHSTVPELSLPAPAQAVVAATPAGGTRTALALFAAEDLLGVSEGLAARATIPLVPTAAARPITRAVETRGMMLLAAYRSQDGGRVVLGGRLINRNLAFIDTMNDLIYREGTDSETYTGTTTLFLDDVRISTNVRLFEGERALGTRVSEVVWQQVMGAAAQH